MTGTAWGIILFLFLGTSLSFIYSGKFYERKERIAKRACFFFGLLFLGVLIGFTFYLGARNTGSPLTQISPGVYKVGFVYQAGENVNLGIEKPGDTRRVVGSPQDRLYLYQFPKKDFDGEIKTGARKLVATKVITGEGTFNRYRLE